MVIPSIGRLETDSWDEMSWDDVYLSWSPEPKGHVCPWFALGNPGTGCLKVKCGINKCHHANFFCGWSK